nr:unnamed protein product [Callosobruchus chinensis]
MGNVHAYSSTPPPPPPGMGFPKNKCETPGGDSSLSSAGTKEVIENPGPLEDIHTKCKNVFPTCFEGARVMLTRGLSNHFQISHTINMSSVTPSGYRFGATYVGTKQISPSEAYPILLEMTDMLLIYGEAKNNGRQAVRLYEQKFPNRRIPHHSTFASIEMRLRETGNLRTKRNNAGRPRTTRTVRIEEAILNNILERPSWSTRTIGKSINVSNNIVWRVLREQMLHPYKFTQVQALEPQDYPLRYTTENVQVSGTLGVSGVHLCYYQRASKQLQIGVELEANHRMQEAVASIGYQVDLPKSEVVFKGHVDSNWSVGAVLEKKLSPLPLTLALSGLMNHNKNQFRLGVGILIG